MSTLKDGTFQQSRTNFHLIPGRLRVGVPNLLNNQDLADLIVYHAVKVPGVRICYANPITGQVLVNFDPCKTEMEYLISWIYYFGNKSHATPEKLEPIPPEKRGTPLAQHNKNLSAPVQESPAHWHLLDHTRILALLGSSLENGLSQNMVEKRLREFGHNELEESKKTSFWQIAFTSLNGFMSKLLLAAGGVSLLVGERADAAVIVAIVLVQAVVEAAQSCQAEKSLDNLKKLSAPIATVLRERKVTKIPSRELVPGDIFYLGAGDIVPADAMIIKAANLTTNEACLTGESIPVVKDNREKNAAPIPIADQANMLFSGTSIIAGRATAVVVTTGMQTELGKIARLLGDVQGGQTNLQKQLDYLGKKITHLVVLAVGTIAIINLLRGRPFWEVLRTGISLAVGAVPEGLPAILTVALSMGVQRMVKRNAVVRNLSAVETLGSTTVICTDKTGTLTKNEMTVKELYIDYTFYKVTGDGYQPSGGILYRRDGSPKSAFLFLTETLKIAALCNNAELRFGPEGRWTTIGDPTEVALLTAAAKAGMWWGDLKKEYCRHQELVFDAERRLMTVVCQNPEGEYGVYVKGAPDAVINRCSTVISYPEAKALDLKTRNKILAANETMAQKALRVLAIAYKTLPSGTDLNEVDLESELIFCGLIGMIDTPREGVQGAIQKCHRAGIKVVMITGDHQKTAEAIAARLGILEKGKSTTGRELEHISNDEFVEKVENIVVYSRTTPEQKLRIVQALKNRGQIVAMTGDGVNDAPAVKEADIGIAMGLSGTDVTRGAADITLSDDNFVTIVNGIEEGRTVNMNLSKSVRYILSGSIGQLLMVFIAASVGLPTPLLPAQILWVNLVTESLPAMAFMADPPGQGYMEQPPFNPKNRFLPDRGRAILRKGMLYGLATFGLYSAGLKWGGWSLEKARTMAFSQLVVNRMFSLINEQKANDTKNPHTAKNPLILPAAALSFSMLAATMYLPFMRPLFSTVPVKMKDWALLIAKAFVLGKIDTILEAGSKQEHNVPVPTQTPTSRATL